MTNETASKPLGQIVALGRRWIRYRHENMADGSSRDIAHNPFAVSVPLRDGMDADCHILLLLTKALPPVQRGQSLFVSASKNFSKNTEQSVVSRSLRWT
mgnify:FL=1